MLNWCWTVFNRKGAEISFAPLDCQILLQGLTYRWLDTQGIPSHKVLSPRVESEARNFHKPMQLDKDILSFAESSSGCNDFAALAVIPSLDGRPQDISLSRLEIPQSSAIFRPTWPMYMKFVEIICDVDRKKAHTHPTRHLTSNWQQICWWPKSGTGWCGCVFQTSLGDAYLRRARFHPSRVSLCPTLSSTTFTFWCQNHESVFGTCKKWNTFEQVDAAIYNIQMPTLIWSWCFECWVVVWNLFIFTPYLAKMIKFDFCIFLGWLQTTN